MYNKNQALKYGGKGCVVEAFQWMCVCIKGVAEPSHRLRQLKTDCPESGWTYSTQRQIIRDSSPKFGQLPTFSDKKEKRTTRLFHLRPPLCIT